ncbi:MAG: bifunctional 5,10-methylene-tetrahydrofolate dehydrogenase/5,10-methylene-tetrahydrofolate cyclohydrolase, partial [Candidatus Curtissbacteria bacterium]
GFVPATTKGVLTMLDHYKISAKGKHVVVIGRSTLVGKPTALAFLNRDATVTVCHSGTGDLKPFTKAADIIISAVGKPGLITKDHVSPGQIVIDIGTTVVDEKLKGDVNFEEVEKIVGWISPVPGGVGPMTVASLFQNLLQAYKNQT